MNCNLQMIKQGAIDGDDQLDHRGKKSGCNLKTEKKKFNFDNVEIN